MGHGKVCPDSGPSPFGAVKDEVEMPWSFCCHATFDTLSPGWPLAAIGHVLQPWP